MKRIADSDITEELNALLALRDLAAAREPKPFNDSSSLTLAALADDMWTEAAGGFLSVKQLPDCGRCSNGFLSVDRGLSYIPPPALPCPHCEVPRRRFARVRYACLPLDAKGVSLSEYEWDSKVQADAILGAQKWLVGDRASTAPNILLHGKPGNGKTTLLYGLALSALDRGLKVRYTSQTRLFDAEKDSWKGDTDSPFKSWLDGVDLLLLDELGGLGGQAQWTAWWKERSREMLGAIYERWRARKLVLVTCTNLEPKQLLSMFDSPAAASRLAEMVRAPIHMTGHDRRMQAWG